MYMNASDVHIYMENPEHTPSHIQFAAMSAPSNRLKVAVIGPKGQCGSCVVDELLSRGHSVVGISRSPPPKWTAEGEYRPHAVDLHDTDRFAQALSQEFDAIVCAYGPPLAELSEVYEHCVESHAKIKEAVLQSTHSGGFIIIGTIVPSDVHTGRDCRLSMGSVINRRSWFPTYVHGKTAC